MKAGHHWEAPTSTWNVLLDWVDKENCFLEQVLWKWWKKNWAFLTWWYTEDLVQVRWGFPPKEHSTSIKTWKQLDDVFGLFYLKGNWTINCIRRNNEISRWYQNSGWKSSTISNSLSRKIMVLNIHLNHWLHGFKQSRLQFCHDLQCVLTWIQLKIYGKD